MDMTLGPIAVRVVKEGLSARAGLALARSEGVKVRDATWYRVVGQIKSSLARQVGEAARPLNRRPTGDEISTMDTAKARGYIQYVDVFVRDKATGLVALRPFAVRGSTLITRQRAVDIALEAMQRGIDDRPADYDEVVLFGLYTATYALQPR